MQRRRYVALETLAPVCDDPTVSQPARLFAARASWSNAGADRRQARRARNTRDMTRDH